VDRLSGATGVCKTGRQAWVSSFDPHFGEEAPLVGRHGSGTIFFTHCNLMCTFCQNYDISHQGMGEAVSDRNLADMMLALQHMGCHNINFVTPTHYDRVETLRLLEGVIDIYMPDFKFWDPETARKTCNAEDYPESARNAILEMHRQVGDLQIDGEGVTNRGLLLRHLVLPHGLAGTRVILQFIADRVSKNTYVNIMPQYRPCGRAAEVPELAEALSSREFHLALKAAREAGIERLDTRRRVFMWG